MKLHTKLIAAELKLMSTESVSGADLLYPEQWLRLSFTAKSVSQSDMTGCELCVLRLLIWEDLTMSKRNKRRFFQSQRAHIRAMLDQGCVLGQDTFDYHMTVYEFQKMNMSILPLSIRLEIFECEVLPF